MALKSRPVFTFPTTGMNNYLNLVRAPARYTGGELNSAGKQWAACRLRVCLCYPDSYEVGMSNLGLRILYHVFNQQPDCLADRVFAPDRDLEAELLKQGLPLAALESGRPPADFDLLGVTLASELCYTNLLTILHLGRVPRLAGDRDDRHPLVIAGGHGAFTPEPMADFCDAFFVGEGEPFVPAAVRVLLALPAEAGRAARLDALARLPGVYVPARHQPVYDPAGRFAGLVARDDGRATAVERVIAADLATAPFPTDWLTPFLPIVHDRIGLEIMRGCPNRCLFCQARVLSGPCRTRTPEEIERLARDTFTRTGYEEMALLSLSTGDYPRLEELRRRLAPLCREHNISISFPSLRADTLDLDAAGGNGDGTRKKMALTLAPESSERLRRRLGKNISDGQLLALAAAAREAGWRRLKLYFMIGLPDETEADLAAIVTLATALSRHLRLNISLNTFIPKPHTPLERAPFCAAGPFRDKTVFLKQALARNRFISLHVHPWQQSFLEAILCRGDRRLGTVIDHAWQQGARFDGWLETARHQPWSDALAAAGSDPAAWLDGAPGPLPWQHVRIHPDTR